MTWLLLLGLLLLVYLALLTGFLHGAAKAQIEAVLALLIVADVVTVFLVGGWRLGLVALGVVFVSALVTRPLAARSAAAMLRHEAGAKGRYIGLPGGQLHRISQVLGREARPGEFYGDVLAGPGASRAKAEVALLDLVEHDPKTQMVLSEFGASRNDLMEIYEQLVLAGAGQWACGHWIPASALAYPDTLRYCLARRGEDFMETVFRLMARFEQGVPVQQ